MANAAAAPSSSLDNPRHDDFESALQALYSSLHQATTKQAIQLAASRRTRTVSDMQTYLRRVGLDDTQLPQRLIHVTGTKGKGSTACLCESIMRTKYKAVTGLFTSPHLMDIRERIRIDGKPVSRAVFGQAYWRVRQALEQYETDEDGLPALPGYFRMLTLVALYIFAHHEPSVTVVILEVGMGGRYDATNILNHDSNTVEDKNGRRTVCGVTLLDYDHVRILGNTLEEIAWEKGGIFQVQKGDTTQVSPKQPLIEDHETSLAPDDNDDKQVTRNDPCFFALDTNTASALQVLRRCAATEGRGAKLTIVDTAKESCNIPADWTIGLAGPHQRHNAELAVALCRALEQDRDGAIADDDDRLRQALAQASWPGRCQSVVVADKPNMTLRLDGAHTLLSVQVGLAWFQSVAAATTRHRRVLVFTCSHERDPVELLTALLSQKDCSSGSTAPPFGHVWFCRSNTERPSAVPKKTGLEMLQQAGKTIHADLLAAPTEMKKSTWQDELAVVWKHLERECGVDPVPVQAGRTVAEALAVGFGLEDEEGALEVFCTGSLYLVGSMLEAVGWTEEDATGSLREAL